MAPHLCVLMLLLFLMPAESQEEECVDDVTDCSAITDDNCINCPGLQLHNPYDCRSFYLCDSEGNLGFNGQPFDCPVGQIFNAASHSCQDGTDCTAACTAGGECTYLCTSDIDKVSDPYDCGIYYMCDGGTESCPSTTPYFDGSVCQTDVAHCCHCRPFCYDGDSGNLISDPTDCRKYYACTSDGVTPTVSGNCPSDQYFDSHTQGCSSSVPCVTLCKNVVDPDGCIDPYTCEVTGFFPKCPSQCTAEYYRCTTVSDEYIEADSCPSGYVFHPDTHSCVTPGSCPYSIVS